MAPCHFCPSCRPLAVLRRDPNAVQPKFKIETKSYRRESMVAASPNAGPKQTPEPPGSVQS